MAENNSLKGRVCVTGGTGYFGSWLVKRLLEHGYSVNTTIRVDPDNQRDISYLTNLPGASERLKIFTADLNDPESFTPAIEGCDGVFHTAHPIDLEHKDTEEVKIKIVTNAMQGILQACLDSKTVRRVVHTSTLSTTLFTSGSQQIDESSWTDVAVVRKTWGVGTPYVVTKVLTEKVATEFSEKHGLDIVHVLPTWISGPFIRPTLRDSVRVFLALILGEQCNYGYLMSASFAHVDDVARAHIHLFEHPHTKGRYLCTGVQFSIEELHELISARYPEYTLPTADSWTDLVPLKTAGIPSKRLIETGFRFENSLEEMLDGAIKSCKEKGLL